MTPEQIAKYKARMAAGEIRWKWYWTWRKPFSLLLSELELGEYTGRKTYVNLFTGAIRIWKGRLRKRLQGRRDAKLPTARLVK